MLVDETGFELSDSGDVKIRKAKLRTLANVRFAFKLFAKSNGSRHELRVESNGWQCIQRSLKVRDRLSHPKRFSDLAVSDDEYVDSYKAFIWFERQVMLSLEASRDALKETHSALTAKLESMHVKDVGASDGASAIVLPKRPDHLDDDV